jgi:hypothetical protein
MDWICGAVEKERNAWKFCVRNCIGKISVGTREADRSIKLLGISVKTGFWSKSEIVVVECLAQCGTSVDVVAVCSPHSLPQERRAFVVKNIARRLVRILLLSNLMYFSRGYIIVPSSCRAVWGVGLRQLACCECGFESRRGHGCLYVVIVVCCQIDISATGRSLVQSESYRVWCV